MGAFDPAVAIDALTDLDHPVKRKAAEWAEENLADPSLAERDRDCRFWPEGWARAAERGITGLLVDPAYGGAGIDVIGALLTFEGLGYGCRDAGLLFGLSTQVWTMQPLIERFGTEEQKRRLIPPVSAGIILRLRSPNRGITRWPTRHKPGSAPARRRSTASTTPACTTTDSGTDCSTVNEGK